MDSPDFTLLNAHIEVEDNVHIYVVTLRLHVVQLVHHP